MPQLQEQDPVNILTSLIATLSQGQRQQQNQGQGQIQAQGQQQGQQQNPMDILSSLVSNSLSQGQQQNSNAKQQNAATAELNSYQKGVNKYLMEAGQKNAMEAHQSGLDPMEIASHPNMFSQQQRIQGTINNQAEQALTPEKRSLLGNILNTVGNITGINSMNMSVDVARKNSKLDQLSAIQKLTGTEQGPDADLNRAQAGDYKRRTNIDQQNANTNQLDSVTKYNSSIIDNVLKQQQSEGTEISADAKYKLASTQKLIAETNKLKKTFDPEQAIAMGKKINDRLTEIGMSDYQAVQNTDSEWIIKPKTVYGGYDMSGLTPEQQVGVVSFGKEVGGVKGAKFVIPSIVESLRAGNTLDNLQDSLRMSNQSVGFSGDYREAAQQIMIGATKSAKDLAFDSLDDLVTAGDKEGSKGFLKEMARKEVGVEQSRAIRGKERTVEFLNEIKGDLKTLEDNGFPTGFFAGTYENLIKKVGQVKNPEMQKIATKISVAIFNYRNAMSGTAFTIPEDKQYREAFPAINKVGALNTANIDALMEVFNGDLDTFYSQTMGEKNYNNLFKSGESSGEKTSQDKPSFKVIGVR